MTSWRPTAELALLEARSELLWKLRSFFRTRQFAEVQTPVLSQESVIDRHLQPIRVPRSHLELPGILETSSVASDLYLQTSPEFAMKRLLAAGMSSIYQICPAFRAGERGAQHNPEFTMVEWYRVGDDLQAGVELLGQMMLEVTEFSAFEQITYSEAFQKYAGCDPLTAELAELQTLAADRLNTPSDFSSERDTWLQLLFDALVQPQLGLERPTVVTHFPASQAALAQVDADDPRCSERFELFLGGVELANGYHELTDGDELANRNRAENRARRQDGTFCLPEESRLVDALRSGFPACSGCALGLDRLLMVLQHATHIDQVIPFPIERC
ncbi:MAG: EF-P lysine aminoacylase EpmA [bacterium]|nr:EF-P lysine aminoacylase EpmA [bacterium]